MKFIRWFLSALHYAADSTGPPNHTTVIPGRDPGACYVRPVVDCVRPCAHYNACSLFPGPVILLPYTTILTIIFKPLHQRPCVGSITITRARLSVLYSNTVICVLQNWNDQSRRRRRMDISWKTNCTSHHVERYHKAGCLSQYSSKGPMKNDKYYVLAIISSGVYHDIRRSSETKKPSSRQKQLPRSMPQILMITLPIHIS